MKVIIIGGVAAGANAAADLRREDPSVQVDIFTKSRDISYAGCGLPYYVGGDIETIDELIVNSPEKFSALTGASVHTGQEAVGVDVSARTVMLRDLSTGSEYAEKYDKLIIDGGAEPVIPDIPGVGLDGVLVHEGGEFINTVKVENASGTISPEEVKRVKAMGCLRDKRYDDIFNVRVITGNGRITAAEQRIIAQAAERYGSGEVTMTSRLTLEIQGVHFADIDDIIAFLNKNDLMTGGTGSIVRPVVSCKGTTCQYGLIDTFSLSGKIHERFFIGFHDVHLPHKFKIAVGGCPNNCVKPDLNDVGIVGQRMPVPDPDRCRGCGKCQVEKTCPINAARVENGKLVIGTDCSSCGRCRGKCPFGAIPEYLGGYKIYLGGRWGRKYANGRPIEKLFFSEEDVMEIIERAILFFRDEGITGERFSDTISRLGFDYVQDKLLNDKTDKDAVLKKTGRGGATC